MNDAHSARYHSEGGPGGDRPPTDAYVDRYGNPYPQQGQYPQGAHRDPYAQGQYQQDPYAGGNQGPDPYGTGQQQPYGYDPYGAPAPPPPQAGYADPYAGQQGYGTGTQPRVPQQPQGYGTGTQPRVPQQPQGPPARYSPPPGYNPYPAGDYPTGQQPPVADGPYAGLRDLDPPSEEQSGRGPVATETPRRGGDYHTEQFAFVEDEEHNEDVIDWLKFAETRTERRDERKRRGRNRIVVLVVVLALALAGGVGYLWQTGRLPFRGAGSGATGPQAQKRDVIVLHLKELDSKASSTALLVNNETTGRGNTVLLPNSLAVSTDDAGSTTLGKSVDEAGAGPTRDALSTLLGADIKGTWRLDTPFLELLVESVGGITVDTDALVRGTGKDKGKTLVKMGDNQQLNGAAAVAYATHRAAGEPSARQLARFGQVIEAVLKKLPSTADGATRTVQSLGSVPDPSLPDDELGASLAPLAEDAKTGKYTTTTLPVEADGTINEKTTEVLVKDVLGGTVKNTDPQGSPRVSVRNASGRAAATSAAQVALVNSGYTFVSGGTAAGLAAKSQVKYSDPAKAQTAKEVAQTLGLPASAVHKATGGQNSDIAVVLGQDYKG